MVKIKEIYDYIDSFAPFSSAAGFDNSGLIIGSKNKEIEKLIVCLDVTSEIIDEAKRIGAGLIISHHPVIFNPIKRIEENAIPYKAIENGIAILSAHTNIDVCPVGTSALMCRLLGLENVEPIDEDGFLLMGELSSEKNEDEFFCLVKSAFETTVKAAPMKKNVKRVAVCAGSGGSFLDLAISKGADALVTGDVKHDKFISAVDRGVLLIDAGHEATEIVYISFLRELLEEQFPNIEIIENTKRHVKFI